jgi:hypothetical protein
MITLYPPCIGTPRPHEPADALEQAKHGAWVGDRERDARRREAADALAWADLGPRLLVYGGWRRRRKETA